MIAFRGCILVEDSHYKINLCQLVISAEEEMETGSKGTKSDRGRKGIRHSVDSKVRTFVWMGQRLNGHQEARTARKTAGNVVPDVRIPEREERRPPRQCNWQKGEVYYWLEPGPSAASNAVVQVREPRAPAVTQIYRVSARRWFKRIGYKSAKQFHWFMPAGLSWGFPPRF